MKKVSSTILPVLSIDPLAPKTLHRQVYDEFRSAIVDGNLRPGQRVPSTRSLASELGISRITVLNAYAQLLAEGYFQSRVGSGTVVCRSLPDPIAVSEPTFSRPTRIRSGPRQVSKRASALDPVNNVVWQRGWGAFGVGQVAFDQFPLQVWNSLVTRQCRNATATSLDYGHPMGLKELREAIATYLRTARGAHCEASQIMIVSGSQQALEITTRVLLNSGDRVWMEEPGYRFARNVFTFHGCQIVPVPVDAEGMNVTAGIRQSRKARAAFVTPSHQYPLGVTMSVSRRMQLLDWAEASGSWIIEDDYDSEYRYESMPIACLQGSDLNSRVVYIGTFSKVLFPSLRLGYMAIPRDLVGRFSAVRRDMDISPPNFYQGVLSGFISEGHFSRHLRRMRLLYGDRRSVLTATIREELGRHADITGGQAGMHLSLTLQAVNDREVAERAARQNLLLVPLSSAYLSKASRRGFILGYGSTSVEEIPAAVRKFRSILTSH